ncbi:MAG: hypothetical protein HY905_17550 [Deltaproteobacteria bacterium]|nr:hypothetical protein [Deltaproteobacteria bacterium]
MLDYMRRNAQSIVIVFVLSILILAFIIEFGPQSKGCRGDGPGAQRSARTVMTVLGYEVTDLEFELWRAHIAMQPGLPTPEGYAACFETASRLAIYGAAIGMGPQPTSLDETESAAHYRNAFLLREALVREAQGRGVAIDDEEIKRTLSRGRVFIFDHGAWKDQLGGIHFCGGELPLRIGLGRDGKLDPNALRAALQQQFQMSVDDFYAFLRRNLLALKMQQLLAAGIGVSPAEVEQAVRVDAETTDVLIWSIGPSVASDEEQGKIQARFDELRAALSEADVDLWLAQESHAKDAEKRAQEAAGAADAGFDPARGKREIARSLLAVDRLAQEARDASRPVRALFSQPGAPPGEPPPVPEGLAVRAHTVSLRPLAPQSELPPSLQGSEGIVERVMALTEAAPVLAEDLEDDAVAAGVTDASGQRYALREVLLVRRTGPWDLDAQVRTALAGKLAETTAKLLASKRASLLDAWYVTQLYAARASDNVDDEKLTAYLDSLRQEQ